jgi:hypothetical protein
MAKNNTNQGGPTHKPKDPPTEDRDNQKVQSRDELTDRTSDSSHRDHAGHGRRNGSQH